MSSTISLLSENSSLEEPTPVLVTTVDMGNGSTAQLTVLEGQDPRDVVARFCAAHGLAAPVEAALSLHILESMERSDLPLLQKDDDAGKARLVSRQSDGVHLEDGARRVKDVQQPTIHESMPTHALANAASQEAIQLPPNAQRTATVSKDALVPNNNNNNNSRSKQRGASILHDAEIVGAEVAAALQGFDQKRPPNDRPLSRASLNAQATRAQRPSSARRSPELAVAPVADRLYADFFRKTELLEEQRRIRELETQLVTQQVHSTPVSRALASHRTASGYSSYGERLYVEGRLDAMRRQQEAEEAKRLEEEAELADATFRPAISKMARHLKVLEDAGSAPPTAWERLYFSGAPFKREARAEAIRKEQDEEELRECSFHPSIDGRSEALVRERRVAAGASTARLANHRRLYAEHRQRERRREASAMRLPEDATFKPRINTSSVVLKDLEHSTAGLDHEGLTARAADVTQRLLEKGRQYQERIRAARDAKDSTLIDPETGQALFRPKTWRPPKVDRNPEKAPIGEYLYLAALKTSAKAARNAEEARKRAAEEAGAAFVNESSERMLGKLRKERLQAIFAYLAAWEGNDSRHDDATSGTPTSTNASVHDGHCSSRNSSGSGTREPAALAVDLLGAVCDEAFMGSIDPEVRADVEHAARLLIESFPLSSGEGNDDDDEHPCHCHESNCGLSGEMAFFQQDQSHHNSRNHASHEFNHQCRSQHQARARGITLSSSGGVVGDGHDHRPPSSSHSHTPQVGGPPQHPAASAIEHYSCIDEARFIELMEEVLHRTRGIARQYLQPMSRPRKKWDDPTFRPAVDPKSLLLAARKRPNTVAAHEILYRTAKETASKLDAARSARDEAVLRECSFRPALSDTPHHAGMAPVAEGKALSLASDWKHVVEEKEKQREAIKAEQEAARLREEVRAEEEARRVREKLRIATRRPGSTHSRYRDETAGGIIINAHPQASSAHPQHDRRQHLNQSMDRETTTDEDTRLCRLKLSAAAAQAVAAVQDVDPQAALSLQRRKRERRRLEQSKGEQQLHAVVVQRTESFEEDEEEAEDGTSIKAVMLVTSQQQHQQPPSEVDTASAPCLASPPSSLAVNFGRSAGIDHAACDDVMQPQPAALAAKGSEDHDDHDGVYCGVQAPPTMEEGIEAIERQIKEALAKLSTTGRSLAASMHNAENAAAAESGQVHLQRDIGAKLDATSSRSMYGPTTKRMLSMGVIEESATGLEYGNVGTVDAGDLRVRASGSLDYGALFGEVSPPALR